MIGSASSLNLKHQQEAVKAKGEVALKRMYTWQRASPVLEQISKLKAFVNKLHNTQMLEILRQDLKE
jgi:hypothetical protein